MNEPGKSVPPPAESGPSDRTPTGAPPAQRKGPWNLLLPALLLPLWFGLGYVGIELTWQLHLALHPQDVGHTLEYWRRGMTGPRFLMLIPPMVGALPLAMIISNAVMHRLGAAHRANPQAAVQYAASQRSLLTFAAVVIGGSLVAAVLGAWLG